MASVTSGGPRASSEALFGVLQQCLRGAVVEPADHGELIFQIIGLNEETWCVQVDAAGARVAPGTASNARATVYCSRAQLEALLTNQPPQEPLRISGDQNYFERVSGLAGTAQDILSVRSASESKS